jgi:CubicO group peptidase (beta-lactamase class C family)
MRNTGYDHPEAVLKFRASGYSNRSGKLEHSPFLDTGIPFSAGSLYSTVEDLYRWDRATFAEKALPKAALEKMFTAGMGNYGYGWSVQTQPGHKAVSHNGGIDGFGAHIARYVHYDLGIIVLGNMGGPASGRIGQGLAAIVFGREPVQ